jgi:hypothetical protein
MPKSNRKTKYTTLLEQCKNLTEKKNIPHWWHNAKKTQNTSVVYFVFLLDFGIVPTV